MAIHIIIIGDGCDGGDDGESELDMIMMMLTSSKPGWDERVATGPGIEIDVIVGVEFNLGAEPGR